MNTGGYIDYWATVPGVRVWISEYPSTRSRDIQTDSTGWWTMYVIKYAGVNLEFSFVYEKDGLDHDQVERHHDHRPGRY